MGSRRRSSAPPISLFSFQDIITSVSGVLIFLTLIMTLELLQRQKDSPPQKTREIVEDMSQAIATANDEIRVLEAKLAKQSAETNQRVRQNPTELRSQKAIVGAEVRQVGTELDRIQQELQRARERAQQAQKVEPQEKAEKVRVEEIAKQTRAIEAKLAELRSKNQLLYATPSGTNKVAWLMEVTGEHLLIARADHPKAEVVIEDASLEERLERADEWARKLDTKQNYVVLIIKPSGIEQHPKLLDALEQTRISIGFDLVEENQTVIEQAAPKEPT